MLAEEQLLSIKLAQFETGVNLLKKMKLEFLADEYSLLTPAQKHALKKMIAPSLSDATYKLAKHHIKEGNKSKGALLLGEATDYGNLNALWDLFELLTAAGHDAYQEVQMLLNIGLASIKTYQTVLVFEKAIPRLLALGKHYLSTAKTVEHCQNTLACLQTAAELARKTPQNNCGSVVVLSITQKMEISMELARAQCMLGKMYAAIKDDHWEQHLTTAITHFEASLSSKSLPETQLALGSVLFELGKILLKKTPITMANQQKGIEYLTRAVNLRECHDDKQWPEGRKFLSEKAHLFAERCLQDKTASGASLALKQLDISITASPTGKSFYLLGVIYSHSTYGKKDLKKARHFFTEAANRQHPDAAKQLAQVEAILKSALTESLSNPFLPK